MTDEARQSTSTRAFGSSDRVSHDSSAFYARFPAPTISKDETVVRPDVSLLDQLIVGDARDLSHLPENSVGLCTTSPPYFVGKDYEEAVGQGAIPGDYVEYLGMLRDVFAEVLRVLEPGGRIAVNVANLGRKPYRSLAGDVTRILQDDLGMLLRGEIVWQKAEGASGNMAVGSYMKPSNPCLRDTSERVIVASKGRFDRAIHWKKRQEQGLPWEPTITKDEFFAATLDVWKIRPESAKKVGHPAPFPVALPQRLIELYTWRDDIVIDPFGGAMTTAVAAARTDRRYVCWDLDASYVQLGQERLDNEAGPTAIAS